MCRGWGRVDQAPHRREARAGLARGVLGSGLEGRIFAPRHVVDAVAAHQVVIVVLGVHPDLVVVHALVARGQAGRRAPAVVTIS